jgi:WD40 repeat protein
MNSAAFSPDGSRIVTASGSVGTKDNTARIWDAETGKELMVLSGHDQGVNSAAFSPEGLRIITASGRGSRDRWP